MGGWRARFWLAACACMGVRLSVVNLNSEGVPGQGKI